MVISEFVDGTTPLDASHLNAIVGGVNDLTDQVDELTDKLLIDYSYISSGPFLDAVDEWLGTFSGNNKKMMGVRLNGASNYEDIPSGFGNANGFVMAFRDVAHIVLFSFSTRGLIATNSRSNNSTGWNGWYVFTGTRE